MKDGPQISRVAALIGDATRAEVLTALMADRALTATELAAYIAPAVAAVSRQTPAFGSLPGSGYDTSRCGHRVTGRAAWR